MAFLRSVSSFDNDPVVYGERLMLRAPQNADHADWAALRTQSRPFLTPWEPSWPRDDLTKPAFRRRLKRYQRDMRDDIAYPFFIFDTQDDSLCGGVTLSNVRRGVAQAASVGYWIGASKARQGYMSRALRTLLPFAFNSLRLHRLEAACLPTNEASIGLLEKTGFEREGFARGYLCINGVWQDHILFAKLRDQD